MEYFRFLRSNAPWLTAGVLLTLLSSLGQTFFISVFAGEIREEFSLSHGVWGGIYTIGTTASAVAMIWAGVLTDRFRVRQLGTVVLGLLSLACLLMAATFNIWMLAVAIFALRFAGQGMLSHIVTVSTARWFIATRGRALSIVTMGYAIGQSILPLAFVALLTFMNWRVLWIVAAVFPLIAILLLRTLLRDERTPESIAKETHAVGMENRQWMRSEVLRHWLFWLMVPLLIGPSAWGTALFFQQVHLTEIKGWTHIGFTALFPFYTLSAVASTFAFGWALDKVGTNRLMPYFMLPYFVAFLIISASQTLFGACIGLLVLGIGAGAGATLPGAFWAEHYGTKNLGGIKAVAMAVMVFGSAIGPGISGWFIDQGVPFPDQMKGFSVYFLLAAGFATYGVRRARPLLSHST